MANERLKAINEKLRAAKSARPAEGGFDLSSLTQEGRESTARRMATKENKRQKHEEMLANLERTRQENMKRMEETRQRNMYLFDKMVEYQKANAQGMPPEEGDMRPQGAEAAPNGLLGQPAPNPQPQPQNGVSGLLAASQPPGP